MKYSIEDIQIFIVTHNRANYLKKSIESVLNQTAGVKEITVLDNESTDNTEETVKVYADRGVNYVKTTGFLGNFYKARELANKPYCMMFHDDDIMHPEYLEFALELLNKYDNISIITTKFQEFWNDKIPKIKKIPKKDYYFFQTHNDFVKYMYFIECVSYANAIYRLEEFKKHDSEYEKYSKFNDWPYMMNFAAKGNSIIIKEPMIYVRIHEGQDSQTFTNMHNVEQCINWVKYFNDVFEANNDYESLKFAKQKNNYFLKGRYVAFLNPKIKDTLSLKEYFDIAEKQGIHCLKRTDRKFSKEHNKYVKKIFKSNLISNKNIFITWMNMIKYKDLRVFLNFFRKIRNTSSLFLKIKSHNLKSKFNREILNVK